MIRVAPGLGGGRLWPAMTIRDLVFWKGGVHREPDSDLCCSGGATDILKGELKCAGQGPHAQLLC